jgi:hypothetical protein
MGQVIHVAEIGWGKCMQKEAVRSRTDALPIEIWVRGGVLHAMF